MPEPQSFSLTLERVGGFEFKVQFEEENLPPILVDELEPIGRGKGPNPARLLGAAVGSCLSSSLLFCLQKARFDVRSMQTAVTGFLERNERGRWRVVKLDVRIVADVPHEEPRTIGRCLEIFEDYCVVTASVRKGIDVRLWVEDPAGNELLSSE